MAKDQGTPPEGMHRHTLFPAPGESPQALSASVLESYYKQGFLRARIDSTWEAAEKFNLIVITGPLFHYFISAHNLGVELLQLPGLQKPLTAYSLTFEQFDELSRIILEHYQNNGYPFARIHRNIVSISNQRIEISLAIEKDELVFFDTLQLQNRGVLSRRFLELHTGIRPGMPYNERKVEQLFDRLSELDFIRFGESPVLRFLPGSARIELPLQKARANRFDGIAGFSSSENAGQRARITGLLNFYLVNTLAEGETLDLNWQASGQGNQQLSVSAVYPYLWRLALGTEMFFSLQKRDTTWLQLQFRPSLLTQPIAGTQWGIFMHLTQGSLISTRIYQQGLAQPEALDFTSRLYGIELRRQSALYQRDLLKQGFRLRLSGAAGNNTIRINANLPPQIYEGIPLKRLQLNGEGVLEKRWRTSSLGTFTAGSRLGWLNGLHIPENQLYRLGGFKTLKGFDELSLQASSFALAWCEYRFFMAENSFFSLLANGGWMERKQQRLYANNRLLGLAAGINLQTQAGIFALYFALGTQKNIPIEFRNAKIHVGYVSVF